MPRVERRAQVLSVAQELFSRDGFHHASMDDIADRAGVSKPVLYRHFPSKLELYLAVVDHRGDALVAAVDQALTTARERPVQSTVRSTAPGAAHGSAGPEVADGYAVVEAIVRAYVDFVEDGGESVSLLFESDVTRDGEVRARVERASAEATEAICRGLHEIAGLPAEEAELLSTALVGMAQVAAVQRHRSPQVDVDDAVHLVSRLAWLGVSGLVRERSDDAGRAEHTDQPEQPEP